MFKQMNVMTKSSTVKKSLVIVVSSPSGGGKTTIISETLKKIPGIRRSISYTTRAMREGEINGKDYRFISEPDFKKRIQENSFVEYEKIFDNYYGTSIEDIEDARKAGEDIVLSIDVKGAKKIKEKYSESISIFIMPPSIEELTSRLKKRNTECVRQFSLRIKESAKEIAASDAYDYMIVNNDLGTAIDEFIGIIERERKLAVKF
ncbi:guanylate kinase [Candidatus Omnitrophus magneticus]|uniref:Guanylate kinase n=1 Tax=Candidatus Omnitrophus magneticus TaxID=1609969 RepID=A0A0F0CSZ5_9BACT|nr:guanylate kinase [Candidatus Omnitrophus magneticus]